MRRDPYTLAMHMDISWVFWQVPTWLLLVLTIVAAVRSGGAPRVLLFIAAGLSLISACVSVVAYLSMAGGGVSMMTSLFTVSSVLSTASGVCLLVAIIIGRPGVAQGQAQPYGQAQPPYGQPPYGQGYGSPQ